MRSPIPRIVRAGSGLSVHLAINAEKVQTTQKEKRNLIDLRVNGITHDLVAVLGNAELLDEVPWLIAPVKDPEITLWEMRLEGLRRDEPDVKIIHVIYSGISINSVKGLEESLIAPFEDELLLRSF
jgi:hypothetical protein